MFPRLLRFDSEKRSVSEKGVDPLTGSEGRSRRVKEVLEKRGVIFVNAGTVVRARVLKEGGSLYTP